MKLPNIYKHGNTEYKWRREGFRPAGESESQPFMVYECTRCGERLDFNLPDLDDDTFPVEAEQHFGEHSESCERRAAMHLVAKGNGSFTTAHQRKTGVEDFQVPEDDDPKSGLPSTP